jgi:endonuclease/exonuclease/phosphatase family metal-dependent hydrolase
LIELLALLPECKMVGVGREGQQSGEYSAILYHSQRLAVAQSDTFWLSDTPDRPSTNWGNDNVRICTHARFVRVVTQQSFYVFNTHLDHQSQLSRERG